MTGRISAATRAHVLVVENRFANVLTHRLPLLKAAASAGYRVSVAALTAGNADEIEQQGFPATPLESNARSPRLMRELRLPLRVARLLRQKQPDLCHLITIRTTFLGLIGAALVRQRPPVVCSITGLGYLFTGDSWKARLGRQVVGSMIGLLQRVVGAHFIFQNTDDRALFVQTGWVAQRDTSLILGSGVDITAFRPAPEPAEDVILFCARYLQHKGIAEFVGAARALKASGISARFALAGSVDPDNPASVTEADLASWVAEGIVEEWGYQSDMPSTMSRASVFVLPSYREGLPKVVLEASASGLAVITTDVPGCRESVIADQTGLLVPARDTPALAYAIQALILDPVRRRSMGSAGRLDAERRFSSTAVAHAIIDVYRSKLSEPENAPPIEPDI